MQRIVPLILLIGFAVVSCKSYKNTMVPDQLQADDTFVFTEPVYIYDKKWEPRMKRSQYKETVSARLDSLFEESGEKYRIAGKFVTADTSFTKEVKSVLENLKEGETMLPESLKRALKMADTHLMLFYFSPKSVLADQIVTGSIMEVIIINQSGIVFYDRSNLYYTSVVKNVDKMYRKLEKKI